MVTMVTSARPLAVLLVVGMATACVDDVPPADPTEAQPPGSTGTTAHADDATTSTTTTAATTSLDSTTSSGGDPDTSTSGPPIIFDLGRLPDGGGPPGPIGIPETCAEAAMTQSTVGCSFHANRMQNFSVYDSSIIVGNVSETEVATVRLYFAEGGGEVAQGGPVMVGPLQSHEFVLSAPIPPGDVSVLRTDGTFRVESEQPIVAYQHSPIGAIASNDSSMLIPDHALGQFHVVASWNTNITGNTSAFNVIGIENDTVVTWRPRNPTSAGAGVPAVAAFALGMATVGANDLLQVVAPTDASGTIVETNKPAWVMGTVPCVQVPTGVAFCDHIEEQLIPVEYWGTEYVGVHAPTRSFEDYWWRVYSGADGVMISTSPNQPGFPVTLDRGEFIELSTLDSFVITGDGAFMPVQYLEGQEGGAGTGDPASYQMVPVEQFLNRYVFVTGTGYTQNYVQVIRTAGGANVEVDGVVVTGYTAVGAYEVADWPISEGAHSAASEQPFGIVQVGYTEVTSYAYPGGLALGFINPNPEG